MAILKMFSRFPAAVLTFTSSCFGSVDALFSSGYETLREYATGIVSSFGQPTRGDPPAWGLGEELTNLHRKKLACYEMLYRISGLADSL
jgi:hypothetical protein